MLTSANERLVRVSESATVALADRVRRLNASGQRIIGLQTGDPDFSTPAPIIEAAYRAMKDGFTHYSHSRGLPDLREAIAANLNHTRHVAYDPASELLVTCGGVHAYFCALQSILNPGDEVLVPDPTWMTHTNAVVVVGGVPVRVPSRAEDDFWPTIEAFERAVTPRTKALVINAPNNPTGMAVSVEYLAELNRFAGRHDLFIVSDEVYDSILYDRRTHASPVSLPGGKERTLLINSLSKSYAMTGWRVGYLAAPADVIGLGLKASQHTITNLAPFVQKAAAFALTDPEMQVEKRRMADTYARRRARVTEIVRGHGPSPVRFPEPHGAFYFFIDVRALKTPSLTISERALEDAKVALVAGSVYGECGEGFLRMTIAASDDDIEAGVRAFLQWTDAHFRK